MSEPFSITRAMSSEEGVYGLILVSGIIAATGSAGAPAWKTLLFTVVTVVVFWLAHVYAGVVAAHGSSGPDGSVTGLRVAIRRAVTKARGMLAATVFPALALLLGAFGVLDEIDSIWLALWVGVIALGWLGFTAYQRKGARWPVKLLGAVSTASFGLIIILAKAVVSH